MPSKLIALVHNKLDPLPVFVCGISHNVLYITMNIHKRVCVRQSLHSSLFTMAEEINEPLLAGPSSLSKEAPSRDTLPPTTIN